MNNPPEPYSHEAHCAWLDSFTPDESAVVHTPPGRLYSYVYLALAKRAVLTPDTKPRQKLQTLEHINSLGFDLEVLAMVEPMGDLEYEIFKEGVSELEREQPAAVKP
jgi:hypothetical protein